ncbi:MAG: thiamine pyrophosphate-dependent dehydrogenase E1 component subunit alpha [Limnochordia bacterium]
MLTSRAVDERASILVRQGKVSFTVGGQGQEAAQVGAAYALSPGKDWVLPYYRDAGVVLTLGMTPEELLLGEFGKANDPNSGGRQMPKHWSYPSLRIVTASSPVATQLPHAVGCALAARLQGEDAVAWVSFGDGAVSKGDFHEALNYAAIHRLPVVFFCENNYYAISVPFKQQSPVEGAAVRASAYGIPGVTVDGNDVFAVYEATRDAVRRARAGEGPTLVEARTYRLAPHTSNDDDRKYRSREEVAEWQAKDPLLRMRSYLLQHKVITAALAAEMAEIVHREVAQAAVRAQAAPDPLPEDVLRHVYADS